MLILFNRSEDRANFKNLDQGNLDWSVNFFIASFNSDKSFTFEEDVWGLIEEDFVPIVLLEAEKAAVFEALNS